MTMIPKKALLIKSNYNAWFAAAAISSALLAGSSAQAQNLLLNTSFEDGPPSGKTQWGYSGGNGSQFDVPAWFTPGATAPADTGEETGGPSGKAGAWAAYLQSGQSGTSGYAAQTTSYVIQSGDTFTLSLLGSMGYTFNSTNATLHYSLYYGGDATTMGTVFGQGDIDLGPSANFSPYSTFSVSSIAATGGAVGQVLGVAFYNSSGSGVGDTSSWIYIDNVSLTAVSAVPEPSTTGALFGLGALTGALALRRRRRS